MLDPEPQANEGGPDDSADVVSRSPQKLGRDTFRILLGLSTRQPWLEQRQRQLLDLIDLCESPEKQALVCDLLDRFYYLSPADLKSFSEYIVAHASEELALKPETTKFCALNKSRYSDSSEWVLYDLKVAFSDLDGWNTSNFVSSMSELIEGVTDAHTVVLVDEFIGSGQTASKAAKWVNEKLQEAGKYPRRVMYCLAAMQAARDIVEDTGWVLQSCLWMKKGISDFYINDALSNARQNMKELEDLLSPTSDDRKLRDHRFGYGKSESIYYAEGKNPPNNVFPIFWWKRLRDGTRRAPILVRVS